MKRWRKTFLLAFSALSVLTAYSFFVEPNVIVVRRVGVENTALESALEGMVTVFISDLDIKKTGYREESLVKKVNPLEPDIIFFGGDFVSGKDGDVRDAVALMSGLKARYGVWAVLGDSDYRSGDVRELVEGLKEAGVNLLRNETVRLDLPNGKAVNLTGLDDHLSDRANAVIAASGRSEGAGTILLTHSVSGFRAGSGDAVTSGEAVPKTAEPHECPAGEWTGWRWSEYDFDGTRKGLRVYFEKDGTHSVRASIRECGIRIERIVLKADAGDADPEKIGPDDVVIIASDVRKEDIRGVWRRTEQFIFDDTHYHLHATPELKPRSFFEATFEAKGAVPYRVFVKKDSHEGCSSTVWLSFSDSVDETGAPRYRTGQPGPEVTADLVLSGHTHGGQTVVPWWRVVDEFNDTESRFIRGIYRDGATSIYVSSGIGLGGMLPVRFLTPPEIAVLEFRRER